MIMSDILFQAEVVAGIVLALWIIWRGQSDCVAFAGVLIAAVLFAMATMVRPLGIVLPLFAALPAVLLPRLSWRRAICMALLAFAISSSTPFAWIARNVQRTGVWILSTDGPIDLYYYKAAGIRWYRGNKSYPAVQDELGRELGWPMQQFTDVPPSLQHEMIRRALKIILHDPVASANMTLRCLGWLAIVPERGSLDGVLGTGTVTPYSSMASASRPRFAASGNVTTRVHEMLRSPLLTALVAVQCVTMIFVWTGVARALVGLGLKPTLERRMILIPFLLAIAFLGLSAGAESVARCRIPVMPLLAMIAAVGWFGQFKRGEADRFPCPSIGR